MGTESIVRWPWTLPCAAAIVLGGYAACLTLNYPGHFTYDSIWQLAQGRAGVFNDWHPPVMAWLLGLADRLRPGAWLFIALEATLFFAALLAFAALEPRPRPVCLPVLALWTISPLALIYQGVALKDVLFADSALAGFAALAWAGRLWDRRAVRGVLAVGAFAMLTLAGLTRQNGAVAPAFGAAAYAALAFVRSTGHFRSRLGLAIVQGALALALASAAGAAATAALEARGDGKPENADHLKILQVYDLAGAVSARPRLTLPILDHAQPGLARFLRAQAAVAYRPAGVDNLFALSGGETMMTPPDGWVGRQWAALITGHPLLYLETRARVWLITLLTPPAGACPMVFTGVEGDPSMLRRAGMSPRQTALDDWDSDYASAFLGTPMLSHLAYGVLTIVILLLEARRWLRGEAGPETMVSVAMMLAALAFAASFFVISIDCDYRFLYFLDVAAMAAAVRWAASRPRAISTR